MSSDGDRTLRSTAERWLRAGPAPDETFGYAASRQYADRQAAVDALAPIVASWPEGRVRTTVTTDPAWKGVAHLAS